jgi:signal transduction histidine kinase
MAANINAAKEAELSPEALDSYLKARKIYILLDSIESSGSRAATIVGNMLSFVRKSDSSIAKQNLSTLIDRTLELAATDYNFKKDYDFKKIKIIKNYASNVPMVLCEASKLQQVFLNIFKNGAEAFSESKSDLKKEPDRFVITINSEPQNDMVKIEISDNGPGMTEEVRKHIFEPFFTTKPVGKGTGLGMSVSFFIITDDHKGTMEVESTPGNGTKFIIRLPVNRFKNRGSAAVA